MCKAQICDAARGSMLDSHINVQGAIYGASLVSFGMISKQYGASRAFPMTFPVYPSTAEVSNTDLAHNLSTTTANTEGG